MYAASNAELAAVKQGIIVALSVPVLILSIIFCTRSCANVPANALPGVPETTCDEPVVLVQPAVFATTMLSMISFNLVYAATVAVTSLD